MILNLYDVLRVIKIIKTENIKGITRAWGQTENSELFNRYSVSVLQVRVMGMDDSNGCTTKQLDYKMGNGLE